MKERSGAPMAAKRRRIDSEAQSLPCDVLSTILFPKLPAKTLVRFRSVSKLWLSMLHGHELAKLHSSETISENETSIIISFTDWSDEKQQLFFSDVSGRISPGSPLCTAAYRCVSQVVNGLICLVNKDRVSVCNLTTREIVDLPVCSHKHRESKFRTSHSCFLFGFDPISDEYKAVKIETISTHGIFLTYTNKCEVFTLGTESWRRVKMGPYKFTSSFGPSEDDMMLHIQSLCINGAIHWVQNPNSSGKRRLARFDVRNERFLPGIVFPPHAPRRIKYPIELGGKLALVDCKNSSTHTSLSIWVLEDYPKQVWMLRKIQILIDASRPQSLPISSSFSDKLYMVRGGENVPFQVLSFDLTNFKDGDRPEVMEFVGLPNSIARASCTKRPGDPYVCSLSCTPRSSGGYFRCLGGLDSLALFITDKMENMYPLKNIV